MWPISFAPALKVARRICLFLQIPKLAHQTGRRRLSGRIYCRLRFMALSSHTRNLRQWMFLNSLRLMALRPPLRLGRKADDLLQDSADLVQKGLLPLAGVLISKHIHGTMILHLRAGPSPSAARDRPWLVLQPAVFHRPWRIIACRRGIS